MNKSKNMQEYDGFSLPERKKLTKEEYNALKKQFEDGMEKIRQDKKNGELYER